LRVPGDRGQSSPRTVTYTEPKGLNGFYTGGDFYYERFRGLVGDPCVSYPFPLPVDEESNGNEVSQNHRYESVRWQMIGDSLRSYFVAGAVRLLISGKIFPREDSTSLRKEELLSLLPPTHSMLYHPSALKDDQFSGAADIVEWFMFLGDQKVVNGGEAGHQNVNEEGFQLNASGLNRIS
jgi:hypothetical protein